jgi:hypothetical protein
VTVAADRPFGAGRHEVAVATGRLAPGAYLARFRTDGVAEVARFTVVR